MSELDLIAKDFVELELSNKTYKFGKITIGALADFQKYAVNLRRKEMIETAREMYPDKIPTELFKEISTPPEDMEEYENRIECVRHLLWLSLKEYQTITEDEVMKLITLDNAKVIMDAVAPPEPEEKKTPESPSKPAQQ